MHRAQSRQTFHGTCLSQSRLQALSIPRVLLDVFSCGVSVIPNALRFSHDRLSQPHSISQ